MRYLPQSHSFPGIARLRMVPGRYLLKNYEYSIVLLNKKQKQQTSQKELELHYREFAT